MSHAHRYDAYVNSVTSYIVAFLNHHVAEQYILSTLRGLTQQQVEAGSAEKGSNQQQQQHVDEAQVDGHGDEGKGLHERALPALQVDACRKVVRNAIACNKEEEEEFARVLSSGYVTIHGHPTVWERKPLGRNRHCAAMHCEADGIWKVHNKDCQ